VEIRSTTSNSAVKKAAKALSSGKLVAFPTETVYGLGADASSKIAVEKIYSVKKRPTNHPLIVHILSNEQLDVWATNIPDYAYKLAKTFWPGPLTLVLNRSELVQNFATAGQESVALRVPSHPVAQQLLYEFKRLGGNGIAAPSANKFGSISPTSAEDVLQEIGDLLEEGDILLEGGFSEIGIESTIIDCTLPVPHILRPGAITAGMINCVSNITLNSKNLNKNLRVPGKLNSHYSPKAKVVVGGSAKSGDGFIALSFHATPPGALRLSSPTTSEEFAKHLYRAFRNADLLGLRKVHVLIPEGTGIELALEDRITRAATNKI
jgi:L-threonylcarbamoyladenylate synthase